MSILSEFGPRGRLALPREGESNLHGSRRWRRAHTPSTRRVRGPGRRTDSISRPFTPRRETAMLRAGRVITHGFGRGCRVLCSTRKRPIRPQGAAARPRPPHDTNSPRRRRRGREEAPPGHPRVLISASRGAAVPSRHRRDSSPGMMEVGGFFSDFDGSSRDLAQNVLKIRKKNTHGLV